MEMFLRSRLFGLYQEIFDQLTVWMYSEGAFVEQMKP